MMSCAKSVPWKPVAVPAMPGAHGHVFSAGPLGPCGPQFVQPAAVPLPLPLYANMLPFMHREPLRPVPSTTKPTTYVTPPLRLLAGNNNEAQQFLSRGAQVIVRMRGLPYDCTAQQVVSVSPATRPCNSAGQPGRQPDGQLRRVAGPTGSQPAGRLTE